MLNLLRRTSIQCRRSYLGAVGVCGLFAVTAARAQSVAQITVGKNVHVSAAHPKMDHWEAIMAADPRDPNRILASARNAYSDRNFYCGVYLTIDGGQTWKPVIDSI